MISETDIAETCSKEEHKGVKASMYCSMCEEFFCSACAAVHHDLLPRHAKFEQQRDEEKRRPIFTGKCPVLNHYKSPLVYFCHTHNVLCCAECKNPGEAHCKCKVDQLKNIDIDALKRAFLADLKALGAEIQSIDSKKETISTSIAELYKKREEFEASIEEIRAAINTSFNRLRTAITDREAALMEQLEEIRDRQSEVIDMFALSTENLCAEAEEVLKAGNQAAEGWDSERLGEMLKAVSDVRCEISKIRSITSGVEASITPPPKIEYRDELEEIVQKISTFGYISVGKSAGKFISEWRKAPLCDPLPSDPTAVVAVGDNRAPDITKDPLPQRAVTRWRIKFLKNGDGWWLWVGVAPESIDLSKTSNDTSCGWYLNTYNSTLFSGPPQNYNSKDYAKGKIRDFGKGGILDVSMNTTDGALSFSGDNGKTFIPAYSNIPLDKPLYPAVIFNHSGHSVQILPAND